MSCGFLVLVLRSIVDTDPGAGVTRGLAWVTRRVLLSGVTVTPKGSGPTGMSLGSLVLVFTSNGNTVSRSLLATKTVLLSGVKSYPVMRKPSWMSSWSLVRVFTLIVDSEPLPKLPTKAVLPSGVTCTAEGDVLGVFLPGLHVDRRHGAASLVGDEGGLAVRRDGHGEGGLADGNVVG